MSDTPAGWQSDPTGKHDHRYWDGSQWTDNVSDAGVASTDPYVAAAAEPPAVPEPGPTDPTTADPVAAAPVADPTTAFSAGGPPPPTAFPPLPAAAVVGGGGGGSKKGLLIGGGILAVVAIIVAILAFSGGSDSGDDPTTTTTTTTTASSDDTTDDTSSVGTEIPDAVRDPLVSTFQQAGMTQDQAECVVDKLIDAYQSGDIAEQDFYTRYSEFFSDCDVDPSQLNPN